MKKLQTITPTPEQLPLISSNRPGIEVIRGGAGSGKTSTAILRLRSLAYMLEERREREGSAEPVRVLVLTFNRTLAGYVQALVDDQAARLRNTRVEVDTFGRWAMQHLGFPDVVENRRRDSKIRALASAIQAPSVGYIVSEIDYLLGRFLPGELRQYLTAERAGRGLQPRVDRSIRQKILDDVVAPYQAWLARIEKLDWNGVALEMQKVPTIGYDVVIVDETQDFSANQLRAIARHLAPESALTFVIDTVQRIYARGFTWAEVGLDMRRARYHQLRTNHRNTVETARFAAGLLDGIPIEEDGSLPDLTATTRHGAPPAVVCGKYGTQVTWSIDFIQDEIDQDSESVAFLAPRGGGYFNELRRRLKKSGLSFVEITRESVWPDGPENIALSTFHSAKGLEFDHVIILGLNEENTLHDDARDDDDMTVARRLLAVAVARARKTVTIGFKLGEESRLVRHFKSGTFTRDEL